MSDLFNSVKGLRPRKNAFNLSHGCSLTTDMGLVVPVFVRDCVPGSDFRVSAHGLGRMLALVAPVMDDIDLYCHFWKIPYRIIDKDFPKFISGEIESSDYLYRYFTPHGVLEYLQAKLGNYSFPFATSGSLFDMFGWGSIDYNSNKQYSSRKFQAYASLIYYEYRVENIELPTPISDTSFIDVLELLAGVQEFGDDDLSAHIALFIYYLAKMSGNPSDNESDPVFWRYGFFRHAWRRDYFTSAFPWVQKGAPVTIPIGGTVPVHFTENADFTLAQPLRKPADPSDPYEPSLMLGQYNEQPDAELGVDYPIQMKTRSNVVGGYHEQYMFNKGTETPFPVRYIERLRACVDPNSDGQPYADLEEATAVTINELRILNALQVYKERKLRYGGRYKEYLKGFFNQSSLDARLDYPEWLGGGKLLFNVSDIAQTSQTTEASPQGNLAGKGTAFGTGFAGFSHTHIYEESLIMGLIYIAPKPCYCQGISRFDTKLNDPFDFFNPSFEHVGEQEIKKYELYGSTPDNHIDDIFGYTPRYAEYRTWPSEVHGDFKSSLSYWKLTRIFNDVPALNAEFVYIQPAQLNRIFATTQEAGHILLDFWFDVKALQPMSKFGTPMLMA